MAFHAVRFPLDIALGARGGPERATDVVTLASGREERNSRWARSRRRFNAGYGVKSASDLRTVIAFFEERRGRFHSFLFRDPLDHEAVDEALGEGDGVRTEFQLVKTYGGAFDPYVREIAHPVEASVVVKVDGEAAEFTPGEGGQVTLEEAPGTGAAVTASFSFDIEMRFESDRLEIEMTSFDAASAPNIPLIEVI